MTAPVLEVDGLGVRYGRALVVRDVGFDLRPGKIVALVGGSGAGKSTVAKALAGLVRPASGTALLRLDPPPAGLPAELDLFHAPRALQRAARRAVMPVLQDPYASLPPHRRVLDIVAEPLAIHRLGDAEARDAAAQDALRSVGLAPTRYARRFPRELSGGERQRVAFARSIVTRPAVILADEPTGMLDASLRAGVDDLMRSLADEHGTAILHITHDLALAARTSDRIIVMADGGIAEQGPARALVADPQQEITRRLLRAALAGLDRVRGR